MGTSAATYGDDNCDELRMSMEDGAKRSTEIELIKTFKSDHDQQKRQQKQSKKCIPTTYGGQQQLLCQREDALTTDPPLWSMAAVKEQIHHVY